MISGICHFLRRWPSSVQV